MDYVATPEKMMQAIAAELHGEGLTGAPVSSTMVAPTTPAPATMRPRPVRQADSTASAESFPMELIGSCALTAIGATIMAGYRKRA